MLWLGTTNASFINGEVLVIDGGLSVTNACYDQWTEYAKVADDN